MSLIISDANIFIDFFAGDLLPKLFQLSMQIGTPDILFEDELSAHHPNLIDLGLHLIELDAPMLQLTTRLIAQYPHPSRLDLTALAVAIHTRSPLITGDRHLRRAAETEQVTVHGTLWVAELLVLEKVITTAQLRAAYAQMRALGSRLPWVEAYERLERLDKAPPR